MDENYGKVTSAVNLHLAVGQHELAMMMMMFYIGLFVLDYLSFSLLVLQYTLNSRPAGR